MSISDNSASFAASELATSLLTECAALVKTLRTLQADTAAKKEFISSALATFGVRHRWVGTRLDILGPDGYVEGPDLKGAVGDTGKTPDITIAQVVTIDHDSVAYVRLADDSTSEAPKLEFGIPKGKRGVSVREDWDVATAYDEGDFVVLSGQSYIARAPNIGQTPIDGGPWLLASARGFTGPTPHITVGSVETLPPHSAASANIDGSAEDPVLHLSLPKGDPGDAYETYSAVIYRPAGVALGSYYLERSASADSVQARLFAEVVAGSAGATVTCHLTVNDVAVTGALTATLGTPVLQTGLTIDIDPGDRINLVITSVSGATEFYFKTYGAVA